MPIDIKGTAPGLVNSPEKPKEIFLKCRNANCSSKKAIDVSVPGVPGHRYQCVVCKHTWSINIGGSVDI